MAPADSRNPSRILQGTWPFPPHSPPSPPPPSLPTASENLQLKENHQKSSSTISEDIFSIHRRRILTGISEGILSRTLLSQISSTLNYHISFQSIYQPHCRLWIFLMFIRGSRVGIYYSYSITATYHLCLHHSCSFFSIISVTASRDMELL